MDETRLKVGLMVPSSNTTVEYDFQCLMPANVSLHSARMWLTGGGTESYARMNEDLETCARHLGSAAVDLIVYACTGNSMVEGPGYDFEICRKISGLAGGAPTIAISMAVREAVDTLQLEKLAVLCPYVDSVTKMVGAYLDASGYRVVSLAGRGFADNLEIGNDPLDEIVAFAKANTDQSADGIFLSCTNWRATSVAQRLEEETGKPVVTSNQATVWAARHRLGLTDSVTGYGRLMHTAPSGHTLAAE